MRGALIALAAIALSACGEATPHPYPDSALARFEASCPADNPVCTCIWEKVTVSLTYEEYEAALNRFDETGLMEPRVTRARTQCLERHRDEG
jgi:hypothetical protein